MLALVSSLPFFWVRLTYSILGGIAALSTFSLIAGNVTAYLCMSVLMEFAIVGIYLQAGWNLDKVA